MSLFSINTETLQSLISFFTQLQGTLEEYDQRVPSQLNELANNWNSSGPRRESYEEIATEYRTGFAKLSDATSEVLAFLKETSLRIEQAEE